MRTGRWFVAGVSLVICVLAIWRTPSPGRLPVALGVFVAISFLAIGLIPGILRGKDGKPSTSKLQLWIWGVSLAFSLVSLLVARLVFSLKNPGVPLPDVDIPEWLLTAVGFSITTALGAKLITTNQRSTADDARIKVVTDDPKYFVSDDSGELDLQKVQLLCWTVVAVAMHLAKSYISIRSAIAPPSFLPNLLEKIPDLDPPLLLLAGLGQFAYLGDKLIRRQNAVITGVAPNPIKAGASLEIVGLGFGTTPSQIVFDSTTLQSTTASAWTDSRIAFDVPAKQTDGTPWPPTGKQVQVAIIVGGVKSNLIGVTVLP